MKNKSQCIVSKLTNLLWVSRGAGWLDATTAERENKLEPAVVVFMPSGIHRFTDLTIAVNPPVVSRGTAAQSGSTTGGKVFSTSAIRSEQAERLTRRCSVTPFLSFLYRAAPKLWPAGAWHVISTAAGWKLHFCWLCHHCHWYLYQSVSVLANAELVSGTRCDHI